MTDIPHGDPGLAAGVTQETFNQYPVFLSNSPPPITHEVTIVGAAANTDNKTFDYLAVVKVDTDGKVVDLADNVSGAHADGAVAIMAGKFVQGESTMTQVGPDVKASVYIQGHFNIDMLGFDATTFDTDAKKLAAFYGELLAANGAKAIPFRNIKVGVNAYNRKT